MYNICTPILQNLRTWITGAIDRCDIEFEISTCQNQQAPQHENKLHVHVHASILLESVPIILQASQLISDILWHTTIANGKFN